MPLFYRHNASVDNPLTYAIWQITETEEELMDDLPYGGELYALAKLRYKSASRRLEWLAVRRLVYELGIDGRTIEYHPSGRPFLSGTGSPYISISHTRGYAAIALHREFPIGIDIEQKGDKILRVKKRFVSEEEETGIVFPINDETYSMQEALLVMWSAKETMFKLMDLPGIDFVNHLHIHPFSMAEKGKITSKEDFTEKGCSFNIHYQIFPEFILACGFLR